MCRHVAHVVEEEGAGQHRNEDTKSLSSMDPPRKMRGERVTLEFSAILMQTELFRSA